MEIQRIIMFGPGLLVPSLPGVPRQMVVQQIIMFGVFFFALGACVGSFLNVVIWRLPNRGREVIFKEKRGVMTLSWPPSHCPVCDAGIRWYQNIPVLSWMVLRGKCAECGTGIPVRYPLVELGTGVLFAGFYLAFFVGHWTPGFVDVRVWPQGGVLGLYLVMAAALLAASAIDADLFMIPLSIPWFLMALGLGASVVLDHPAMWRLGASSWWMAKPIAGGAAGLVLANVLLWTKVIPRSFSGPEFEEARVEAEGKAMAAGKGELAKEEAMAPPPKLTRYGPSVVAAGVLTGVSVLGWGVMSAAWASLVTVVAGILIFLIGVLPRDEGQVDVTDEVMEEISSPLSRREIVKELVFFLVPVVCCVGAYWLPFELPREGWVGRLLGSLLGLLVGGGIVWATRILGTLVLNREAMGIGDAHLMAGVGAVVGAPLTVIAFLALAPVIGIMWAVVLKWKGKPNVLPYGPWLSVASILGLLVGNPLWAWYTKFAGLGW